MVDVPPRHRHPVAVIHDLLLPRSDRTALVQVIVVVIAFSIGAWFARGERAVLQLVIGVGLVVLGLMAMRTLH